MKKDMNYRIQELQTALKALQFGIDGFHKSGDEAHLLGVKATLRALVALGGRTMTPLLLDLAKEINLPLEFYSLPPEEKKSLAPHVNTVRIITSKSWSIEPQPGMQRYTLEEWLELPAYLVTKTQEFKCRNDVLRQISESEGGAHFDKKIKIIVDELQWQSGSRYNGIQFFLVDISALVYWLGQRLVIWYKCMQKGDDPSSNNELKELRDNFQNLHISMI